MSYVNRLHKNILHNLHLGMTALKTSSFKLRVQFEISLNSLLTFLKLKRVQNSATHLLSQLLHSFVHLSGAAAAATLASENLNFIKFYLSLALIWVSVSYLAAFPPSCFSVVSTGASGTSLEISLTRSTPLHFAPQSLYPWLRLRLWLWPASKEQSFN